MPLLYFARHGESEANRLLVFSNRDLPHGLTDVGRAQVEDLAQRLHGVAFAALYASPILRARESAEILASRLGLSVQVTPALAEFDMGVLEGTSADAGWQRQKALFEAWLTHGDTHACIEGGESFEDIRARFVPFVEGLQAHPPDAHFLLMGHGGTYMCMLPALLTNVTHRFAWHHPLAHCDVVVARLEFNTLTCLRWGNHSFTR